MIYDLFCCFCIMACENNIAIWEAGGFAFFSLELNLKCKTLPAKVKKMFFINSTLQQ